jgi:hypothetical protein
MSRKAMLARFHLISPLTARLLAGAALMILPATLTLSAADPPAKKTAAASSQPASTMTAAEAKEKKKQEEIDRVMDFFHKTQPDVYEQAKSLRDSDPVKFEQLVRPAINTVDRLENMRKRNPELFTLTMKDLELNYQSLRLARQLKQPDLAPADHDKIVADLSAKVTEEFAVRQQIRQKQIEDLQAQLKQLGDKLQNNETIKDVLIKKRIDDLEKSPRLEW